MAFNRKEYRRQHYLANKEKNLQLAKSWQLNNKEKCRKAEREYSKRYPAKLAAKAAHRRAYKLHRTPYWLTKEQRQEIKDIYNMAKELSWLSDDGLVVDHIVPLKGRNVSGLHVPSNLQIIPSSQNAQKGNRFE